MNSDMNNIVQRLENVTAKLEGLVSGPGAPQISAKSPNTAVDSGEFQ